VHDLREPPVAPVLRLVGDLVGSGGAGIRSALATMAGEPDLILDLADMGFVDAASLGAVASGIRAVQRGGGRVVIVSPRPSVTRALTAAGLAGIAPVTESVAEARLLMN